MPLQEGHEVTIQEAPEPLRTDAAESSEDTSSDENDESPHVIGSYIPVYLKQYVAPYYGDFCQTPIFHERLIAQLISEGFLPIATRGVLLPKLHRLRCVIRLPEALHVSKSSRKKAKKYLVSINLDFDGVVRGCHVQHGRDCWLHPPLVEAFKAMNKQDGISVRVFDDQLRLPTNRTCKVRLYSVELWDAQTGELVAGELGYTLGSIYTSLTGFANQDGSGSVQLAVLGRLLCQSGFEIWDLGMDMEYKRRLGAHLMPRNDFLREVVRVREKYSHLVLPRENRRVYARNVIDRTELPSSAQVAPGVTSTNGATPTSSRQIGMPRPSKDKKEAKQRKKTTHRSYEQPCPQRKLSLGELPLG